MGVLWHKVWFDLWHNKTRTLLAVLSVGAGAFAVGAIFGMSDQLITTMDSSHQSTMPPHINIVLGQPVDRDTLLNLQTVPGVEGVEPYNSVMVLYKLQPESPWRQGVIQVRDYEHQQYELVQLRQGHWPVSKDDIGIERMAAQANHLGIGSSIILKVGDQERTLKFTSFIRHPFVPPPQFEDLAFLFMSGQGLERYGIPNGDFNSIYVRVTPYSADYAKEVATAIKDKLAKQDLRVVAFTYQDPNRHWGRAFMDGFVLVQEMLAILCVLMSVILVYNTLSNLITQQTNQIGILKAIGARRGTIVGVYLVNAFIYGFLALLIAVPLGAAVAFGVSRYFLDLFNIDYNQFRFSNTALVAQVICALAAPLLAGLVPILQGASMTVRQAISSYGLGGGFGSSWFDRLIENIGRLWLPSHYATALGNMFRHKARLLMTELVLVTAGTAFLMVTSLNSSIWVTLNNIYARNRYDTVLRFSHLQRIGQAGVLAMSVPGVQQVELHLVQPASIIKAGQLVKEAGIGTNVEGIPAESDFFKPLIVAGRWIQPSDGRALVITRDTGQKNDIRVGDMVTLDLGELGKDKWIVVGWYDPIFAGGFNADSIYAPAEALYLATKKYNQGTQLIIRTTAHDGPFTEEVTRQVKNLLEDRGMKVSYSETQSAQRSTNAFQFGIVIDMMLALSVIVALVGGIALMGALSIGVIERTKEIGVLRAVGARSRTILGIFVMEGILQGVLSCLIAIPVSLLTSPLLAEALGKAMFGASLDYGYNWQAVGVWFGIMLFISAIASIVPANSATQISVRDSLAYA
ncbi:MAG TPA: FtsX-like permease family protein [Anaerolineales bacterium]|nr:FtsX-like permease family protein [Anaerolineales bacterium]